MASSLFIHSYSSKVECNIRDSELNSKIPPSLVIANNIIRILFNEIQANYTIKGGPLGDIGMLKFSCTFLLIGDAIHLSKWRRLRWRFLWDPFRRVYQLPTKFVPLILPFSGPNKSSSKNVHL